MSTWKYSVILGFLGKLSDRFASYGEQRDIAAKFDVASQIEGFRDWNWFTRSILRMLP